MTGLHGIQGAHSLKGTAKGGCPRRFPDRKATPTGVDICRKDRYQIPGHSISILVNRSTPRICFTAGAM